MTRLRLILDPFLMLLISTVVLASILPARGEGAHFADVATDIGIVLLFFLHGAKLPREAIQSGAKAWRLHLATLATTFVAFPLIGLATQQVIAIPVTMRAGLLFLTLLPSTVQSSIAFTAIARGNVAAAVVGASFSNLLGIFLTPLLVALLMQGGGAGSMVSLHAIEGIVLQLLLPFTIGHLLRPWIGGFVDRHRALLGRVDRGTILLVVYSAFSVAVVEGLWHKVSRGEMLLLAGFCCAMLGIILLLAGCWAERWAFRAKIPSSCNFAGPKRAWPRACRLRACCFPPPSSGRSSCR